MKSIELATTSNDSFALTVDIEDYFQVSAFEDLVVRKDWSRLEHRVEANTHKVLDLFAQQNVKSTFFVLGWVAQQYPQLITRIINEGHELASHGFYHQRLTQLSRAEVENDITSSKGILEDISGAAIKGYRAPSFSINQSNIWVLDVLAELGFQYSSSTYPVKHDLYGEPTWPRKAYKTQSGIIEIPLSTLQLASRNWPISGGGYFRILPFWLSRWAINRFKKTETQPYMFYFHPWEIDPLQPRFTQAKTKSKFRHYSNLSTMESKITKLLSKHKWQTIEQIYFK